MSSIARRGVCWKDTEGGGGMCGGLSKRLSEFEYGGGVEGEEGGGGVGDFSRHVLLGTDHCVFKVI